MKKLCFHQVLITQSPEALREAIRNSGQVFQSAQYDRMVAEQNLLRQLASASDLPTTEIEITVNDTPKTTNLIANWIEEVGGNIPPEDYSINGVIVPKVC